MSTPAARVRTLIEKWRQDPAATYRTWFLWDERLKNFRSIRSGIAAVVDEIERDGFGNVYNGSSLQTVVGSVAEQRHGGRLADGCRVALPAQISAGTSGDTVGLIDVLWIDDATDRVAAAFEVEHTTSIYSGIVRMLDLALGFADHGTTQLFLVAPDSREERA